MEETYNFEDRQYLKPEVSRDEQLGFIDNLRSTQTNDLNKISRDTYNMGTPVTSNLGGLHGSEGIWSAQHVNPQTNALVADLKATAQASALNTALSNMQQQYKNAYDQAKRSYTKRQNNKTNPSNDPKKDPYNKNILDDQIDKYANEGLNMEKWRKAFDALGTKVGASDQEMSQAAKQAYYNAFGGYSNIENYNYADALGRDYMVSSILRRK